MIPSESYHIFNHANGRENLFIEEKNYEFFLLQLTKYILPACRLYSYCLMPNHFHLVLQVRHEEELLKLWQYDDDLSELTLKKLELKISKSFSNFFSSYTQSFNKVYKRMGSLFIPSMKIAQVKDDTHFCKLIHYTHANPVHHGFTKRMEQWPHSSYKLFLSQESTYIEKERVLKIFGGLSAFIKYHEQPIELKAKFINSILCQRFEL